MNTGDIIKISVGDRVTAVVPVSFINAQSDKPVIKTEITISGLLSYLAGDYVVSMVESIYESDSHAEHTSPTYAGKRIHCQRLDNYDINLSFKPKDIADMSVIGKCEYKWIRI